MTGRLPREAKLKVVDLKAKQDDEKKGILEHKSNIKKKATEEIVKMNNYKETSTLTGIYLTHFNEYKRKETRKKLLEKELEDENIVGNFKPLIDWGIKSLSNYNIDKSYLLSVFKEKKIENVNAELRKIKVGMSALAKTLINLKLKMKSVSNDRFYDKWNTEMESLMQKFEELFPASNERFYQAAIEENEDLDLILERMNLFATEIVKPYETLKKKQCLIDTLEGELEGLKKKKEKEIKEIQEQLETSLEEKFVEKFVEMVEKEEVAAKEGIAEEAAINKEAKKRKLTR